MPEAITKTVKAVRTFTAKLLTPAEVRAHLKGSAKGNTKQHTMTVDSLSYYRPNGSIGELRCPRNDNGDFTAIRVLAQDGMLAEDISNLTNEDGLRFARILANDYDYALACHVLALVAQGRPSAGTKQSKCGF